MSAEERQKASAVVDSKNFIEGQNSAKNNANLTAASVAMADQFDPAKMARNVAESAEKFNFKTEQFNGAVDKFASAVNSFSTMSSFNKMYPDRTYDSGNGYTKATTGEKGN